MTQKNYRAEENIVTCPGGILSIDVAAHLVKNWGNLSRTFKALDYLLFNYETPQSYFPWRPYQEELDRASKLTRDAVRLMEANIEIPYKISQLAENLNTTCTRLHRAFDQDLDQSPGRFWLAMMLELSSKLLIEQRLTITEIGFNVGFSDTAHFCRSFKAKFDVSPRKYRQNAINPDDFITWALNNGKLMRAFILSALKEKGLDVTDEDLLDLRRRG